MDTVRLTSLADQPISVRVTDGSARSFPQNSHFSLLILINNEGDLALTWAKSHPLVLSYRWYDEQGEAVRPDGPRTRLPAGSLAPGASVELDLTCTTPSEEGAYKLYVSLLLEGVDWAYQVSSSGWCEMPINVSAAPAWPEELSDSPGGRALRGALAAAEIARSLEDRPMLGEAAAAASPADDKVEDVDTVDGAPDIELPAQLHEVRDVESGNPAHELDELLALASRQERRVAELLAELGHKDRQIRDLEEQVRASGGLKGLREDLAVQTAKIQVLLEETSGVQQELRHGPVSQEMLSSLRRLAGWSATTNDAGLLSQINDGIEEVRQLARGSLEGGDQRWQAADQRFAQQSLKLDSLLLRQAIPLQNVGVILVRNRFGLLAIQDDDPLAIAYYSSGELPEPATVTLVDRLLEAGSCFVDVGANIGVYSVISGRRVGPSGRVISVEPTPSTMRALRTTLAINGLSEIVETHECALGKDEGSATLNCEATSGHNTLLPPSDSTRESHTVSVQTGDALLSGVDPSLIKIDVEGWELEVLEGLANVIQRSKDLSLVIEYSPAHVQRRNMKPGEWIERLQATGLKIWAIDDADISLRPLQSADELGDSPVNLFLSREVPPALSSMLK